MLFEKYGGYSACKKNLNHHLEFIVHTGHPEAWNRRRTRTHSTPVTDNLCVQRACQVSKNLADHWCMTTSSRRAEQHRHLNSLLGSRPAGDPQDDSGVAPPSRRPDPARGTRGGPSTSTTRLASRATRRRRGASLLPPLHAWPSRAQPHPSAPRGSPSPSLPPP